MGGDAGDRSTFRTKTGWGTSGKLIAGNKQQRVTMQADFNKGVGAFDFTVQFNLDSGSTIVNAEALIHWRVEGQEVTRRITIGDGASLTGTGQAVRVEMSDATPPTSLQPMPSPATATVTNGSPDVEFTLKLSLPQGARIVFTAQLDVTYVVAQTTFNSTGVILTTPYTGPSGAGETFSTLPPIANETYTVSVQVSAGIRGSSGQPPVLQPYDAPPYVTVPTPGDLLPGGFIFAVPAGEVAQVHIPDDAGVTQMFVTAVTATVGLFTLIAQPTLPATAIVALKSKSAATFGADRIWDTQITTGWVPVSPGADLVLLSAAGAAPGTFILYSMSYGIDG